jgi:hypothetical protein
VGAFAGVSDRSPHRWQADGSREISRPVKSRNAAPAPRLCGCKTDEKGASIAA